MSEENEANVYRCRYGARDSISVELLDSDVIITMDTGAAVFLSGADASRLAEHLLQLANDILDD